MAQPRVPRRHLNPALRVAVYRSGKRIADLASSCGFPNFTALSSVLNADYVRETPLVVGRVELLAHVVGFDGPVFDEERPLAPPDRARAAHLPESR